MQHLSAAIECAIYIKDIPAAATEIVSLVYRSFIGAGGNHTARNTIDLLASVS